MGRNSVTGRGSYNAYCQSCGRKYKFSELRQRPEDNLWVCPDDWEPIHPAKYNRYHEKPVKLPFVNGNDDGTDVGPTYGCDGFTEMLYSADFLNATTENFTIWKGRTDKARSITLLDGVTMTVKCSFTYFCGGSWQTIGAGTYTGSCSTWKYDNDETTNIIAEMTTAPSDARAQIIDTLVTTLKACGVWDLLDCLYIFAAHDEQAATLNWIDPSGTAITNTACTFTTDEGFTSADGSVLDTGIAWNALTLATQDDHCAGAFITDAGTVSNNASEIYTDTGIGLTLMSNAVGDRTYQRSFSSTLDNWGGRPAGYPSSWKYKGMFFVERTGASAEGGYFDGNKRGNFTTASTTPGSATMKLLYQSGVFDGRRMAAYSIGSSLTAAQKGCLDAAISDYLIDIGSTFTDDYWDSWVGTNGTPADPYGKEQRRIGRHLAAYALYPDMQMTINVLATDTLARSKVALFQAGTLVYYAGVTVDGADGNWVAGEGMYLDGVDNMIAGYGTTYFDTMGIWTFSTSGTKVDMTNDSGGTTGWDWYLETTVASWSLSVGQFAYRLHSTDWESFDYTMGAGQYTIVRSGANSTEAYKNGSNIHSGTTARGTSSTNSFRLGRDSTADPHYPIYGDHHYAIIYCCSALDATQVSRMYTILNTYMTNIGAI